MELTRRQEAFIYNLLDIYRESQKPVHYTALADRLGVSRFTAYDMLRLLEEKGYVERQYRLDADKTGPGRSEITFIPTAKAHRLIARLTGNKSDENWENAKERALEKIVEGKFHQKDLEVLLVLAPPEGEESLRYCIEIMTIIGLRLQRGAGRKLLREYIPMILPSEDEVSIQNLSLFGGFALGILAHESANDPDWGHELFEHIRKYQSLITEMEPAVRNLLAARINEIFANL